MSKQRLQVLYILGGGHSGSTILSLILGTSAQVVNAGEIKFYNEHPNPDHPMWRYIENVCTCGKDAMACPFWQRVDSRLDGDLDIFHYSRFDEKLVTLIKILNPFYRTKTTQNANDDFKLLNAILEQSLVDNPSTKIVLDSSKSVARLMHLRAHAEIDVKVIFLIRDGRAYANSFRNAYKKGFTRWIAQWMIVNFLSLRYLRKEKIDHYYLTYNSLCLESKKNLSALEKKFNIKIPDEYVKLIREKEYHVRAGNPSRKYLNNFTGLELEEKWRRELPKQYQRLASAMLYIFSRKWL